MGKTSGGVKRATMPRGPGTATMPTGPHAGERGLTWTTEMKGGDEVVVSAPIDAVNALLDPEHRVEKSGVRGRKERAMAHFQAGNPMDPSRLSSDSDYGVGYTDGRHRQVAAQELGATHGRFAMTEASLADLQRRLPGQVRVVKRKGRGG